MNPCGKYWYKEREEAEAKVARMKKQPTVERAHQLNAYFCTRCEGWHVGRNYLLKETA
jgi:hypothetical protein